MPKFNVGDRVVVKDGMHNAGKVGIVQYVFGSNTYQVELDTGGEVLYTDVELDSLYNVPQTLRDAMAQYRSRKVEDKPVEWEFPDLDNFEPSSPDPLKLQYGGDHYKGKGIQPIEFILTNKLGFCEGNVVKYVTRYKEKNGIEDLKKARHYLDFLIEELEKNV